MVEGQLETPAGVLYDFTSNYKSKTPKQKKEMMAKLNNLYYNATIPLLFRETDSNGNLRHEGLKEAYENVLKVKEQQRAQEEILR